MQMNKTSVEKSFDRRLQIYQKLLATDIVANLTDNEQLIGQSLQEPLFDLPESGWYWQITRIDKNDIFQSRSVFDWNFESLLKTQKGEKSLYLEGYILGPNKQPLRVLETVVNLEKFGIFRIEVAGNAQDIYDNLRPFNIAILLTFLVLFASFLAGTFMQVRLGLNPLYNLTSALSNIRNGKTEKLEGNFVTEITPLTHELNALITSNKEIVERARTHVGNLAHALKTPLSVLQNEALEENTPLSQKILAQTDMMKVQINQHLERAKLAARTQYISTVLEVHLPLKSLIKTLEKINMSKGITISNELEKGIKWRGEANDLLEMSGNLIDNAFKWAKSHVFVSMQSEGEEQFSIIIDDDGKALSQDERDKLGVRGTRLDENKKGSGLGLSISSEIARLYRGSLALEPSPLGGLRVIVTLQKVSG